MTMKNNYPPDQHQRNLILTELDKNMLVEAAAGTGKTTSMVGRMVALLRTGKCKNIRHIAAVTFTRKAAAELRGRFQVALEKVVRDTDENENLQRALASIEQCFIGTIHSFCGRLLRERPVEAQVDIAFEEIDEDADERLRKEAWDEYTAVLLAHDQDGVLAELDQLGLRLVDLENAFMRFTDFPDVDEWPMPGKEKKLPDLDDAVKKIREYVVHMEELAPDLPDDCGNDKIIPKYKSLPRIISHYDLHQPSQMMAVLTYFSVGAKPVQKKWKNAGFTGDDAKEEEARWERFRREVAEPLLNRWYEYRYGPIMRVMFQARKIYDDLRRERGLLNYQDLLIKAAELLRDKPHIRQYFRDRFRYLLIDEFQDTDPIQAEVMLLLTATDLKETQWRKSKPRPGSLFVVGDPKQSIYRFRRADIVTYTNVKEIICGGGGEDNEGVVVQLSANFRTVGSIIDWVNGVFEPQESDFDESSKPLLRFPKFDSKESPCYVSLQCGRTDGNEGQLAGLYRLDIPEEFSKGTTEESINYEAGRIARTIRHVMDSGITIPRTRQQIEQGCSEGVNPSDFMIITRIRKHMSVYARMLQEYGIPHQVTGGSALNEVDELRLLYTCLTAVMRSDDPVALVATLRSELFGISDVALYNFKKTNGKFSYLAPIPEELSQNESDTFRDTFTRLKRYALWFSKLPPISALEKIVADLGLMVSASARPGGDVEAGSLAKSIEILRSAQHQMWTTAQIVERLGKLVELEESYDGISARSEEQQVVRIMNLHKVKGLEAPVIFLADPSGGGSGHGTNLHIDRSQGGVLGYMAVRDNRQGYHAPLLAQPEGWKESAEKEKRFLDAESLRLRYVAATRAGSAMIISQKAKYNNRNPWQYFDRYLTKDSEISDPGKQMVPIKVEKSISINEVNDAFETISKRTTGIKHLTYDTCGAREYAFSLPPEEKHSQNETPISGKSISSISPFPKEAEHGVEWGTVIHQLLQLVMENPQADLPKLAQTTLLEQGLDSDLAETAIYTVESVMKSEIWQRALKSKQRLTEVPFQVLLEEELSVPTVVRGVIDLIFREDIGWILVDYKTDNITEKNASILIEKYSPQVKFYAKTWEECTDQTVKEVALYFLQADLLVSLD